MTSDITTLTAAEIVTQIKERTISAVEVTEAHLERSEKTGEVLNSWIKLDPEGALKAAQEVDAAIARGDDPGAHGRRADRLERLDRHGGPAYHCGQYYR